LDTEAIARVCHYAGHEGRACHALLGFVPTYRRWNSKTRDVVLTRDPVGTEAAQEENHTSSDSGSPVDKLEDLTPLDVKPLGVDLTDYQETESSSAGSSSEEESSCSEPRPNPEFVVEVSSMEEEFDFIDFTPKLGVEEPLDPDSGINTELPRDDPPEVQVPVEEDEAALKKAAAAAKKTAVKAAAAEKKAADKAAKKAGSSRMRNSSTESLPPRPKKPRTTEVEVTGVEQSWCPSFELPEGKVVSIEDSIAHDAEVIRAMTSATILPRDGSLWESRSFDETCTIGMRHSLRVSWNFSSSSRPYS
jgi:hypothetical protein